jgi:Zn finger protein HypA/HybF involved in hydrogenase expression
MSDEPFKSWVEQVNRPMRTEERVCVIDEAHTAITVKEEVVRCRDCKHFTADEEFWVEPPTVPFPMHVATSDSCDFWAGTKCKVEPDGFCAWGERRSG